MKTIQEAGMKMTQNEHRAAIGALYELQQHVRRVVEGENRRQYGQPNEYSTATSDIQKEYKSYPFIPLHPGVIIAQLVFAQDYLHKKRKAYGLSFLDAGCGPGNILLLAAAVGYSTLGLEFDPVTIQAAKHFNPRWKDIKRQNILTYRSYGKFDVVYYYCPIQGPLQTKFEERVEDQMKVGALLIPHLKKSDRIFKDKRFKRLKTDGRLGSIYEKVRE